MTTPTPPTTTTTPPTNTTERQYLSREFPESPYCGGCCDTISGKGLVESWENERDAWHDGQMLKCCGHAMAYRGKVVVGTAVSVPASVAMALCGGVCALAAGACAGWQSLSMVICCPLTACCCSDTLKGQAKRAGACWKAAFGCVACSGGMAFNAVDRLVCCPPNLIAGEGLNAYCGQSERALKQSLKMEENRRKMNNIWDD